LHGALESQHVCGKVDNVRHDRTNAANISVPSRSYNAACDCHSWALLLLLILLRRPSYSANRPGAYKASSACQSDNDFTQLVTCVLVSRALIQKRKQPTCFCSFEQDILPHPLRAFSLSTASIPRNKHVLLPLKQISIKLVQRGSRVSQS
jgi:hypothetical protein